MRDESKSTSIRAKRSRQIENALIYDETIDCGLDDFVSKIIHADDIGIHLIHLPELNQQEEFSMGPKKRRTRKSNFTELGKETFSELQSIPRNINEFTNFIAKEDNTI